MLRFLSALAIVAAFTLAGCDADSRAPEDAGTFLPRVDAGPRGGGVDAGPDNGPRFFPGMLTGSPATLSFSHMVRVSPCPQDVGDVTLTNTGTSPINFTTSAPPMELLFAPTSGTVPGGGTATVNVSFTCRVATIPSRLVETLTIMHDGAGADVTVQIAGDIN